MMYFLTTATELIELDSKMSLGYQLNILTIMNDDGKLDHCTFQVHFWGPAPT